jgi:prepilin-type processing-associated H-X9-DG protein
LVVVAIIAVLVAILLPSLSQARQSAMDVGCSATLSQTGLLFAMFWDEHNGLIPAGGYVSGKWEYWWPVCVLKMAGVKTSETQADTSRWGKFLACPSAVREFGPLCLSYALNCTQHDKAESDAFTGQQGFQFITGHLSKIQNPDRCPLLVDAWQYPGWPYAYNTYTQFFWSGSLDGNPPRRHGRANSSDATTFTLGSLISQSGGFNVLFFDGHVSRCGDVPASWRSGPREFTY